MVKYTAKECRCWSEYPNPAQKKSNGQWKCVDCYELVKEGDIKTKTRCKLREVKEMKLEKVIEVLQNMIDVYGLEYENEEIEAIEIAIYVLKALFCINGLYKWEDCTEEDMKNSYDYGYQCGYNDARCEMMEEEENNEI